MKTLLLSILFTVAACAQTSITIPNATNASTGNIALSAAATPGQIIYVDREAMLVQSVNGLNANVIRGFLATTATAHTAGVAALVGNANNYIYSDPAGACSSSTNLINPANGRVWACASGVWSFTLANQTGTGAEAERHSRRAPR